MSTATRPETSNISQFISKLYAGTVFHKRSPESPAACQGLDLSKPRADFDSSRKLRCVRMYDYHSALGCKFLALSLNTPKWFVSTMYRRSCKKSHARCHVSWRLTAQGIRQHGFADKILQKFRFPPSQTWQCYCLHRTYWKCYKYGKIFVLPPHLSTMIWTFGGGVEWR